MDMLQKVTRGGTAFLHMVWTLIRVFSYLRHFRLCLLYSQFLYGSYCHFVYCKSDLAAQPHQRRRSKCLPALHYPPSRTGMPISMQVHMKGMQRLSAVLHILQ